MKKEPEIFIDHILESINLIEEYLQGVTRRGFLSSVQIQDSVIRRIEIIGEAVKNIPRKLRDEYPDIPWKEIAAMRDMLIHEYFGVDLAMTWRVATKEVAQLKKEILKVKRDLQTD